MRSFSLLFLVVALLLNGCVGVDEKRITLDSLDSKSLIRKTGNAQVHNSNEIRLPRKPSGSVYDAKHAYEVYLQHAPQDDKNRNNAIRRLAEIELQISQSILSQQDSDSSIQAAMNEQEYQAINNAKALYENLLEKQPPSSSNDEILYRLAYLSEKQGQSSKSITFLETLVKRFPQSKYFNEAQFRIAEKAFMNADYKKAEVAYSAVIFAPRRSVFYERSLFKRGWCRYKQNFYFEAVDDYFLAISVRDIEQEKMEASEKQKEKYYEAIALAFAKKGGVNVIEEYFQKGQSKAIVFKTYQQVASLYFKQKRYLDAAMLYEHFLISHPDSFFYFDAFIQNIKIWEQSGYEKKYIETIEKFYLSYRSDEQNVSRREKVDLSHLNSLLEKYGLAIASYYHFLASQESSKNNASFLNYAQLGEEWYRRFVRDFSEGDKVITAYYQYAELLVKLNQIEDALSFYRKAAYGYQDFKHQEAAYALLSLADETLSLSDDHSEHRLLQLLNDAEMFCRTFPGDIRANDAVVHIGKKAIHSGKALQTLQLLEVCRASNVALKDNFYILLADSYFDISDYVNAEKTYKHVFLHSKLSSSQTEMINERLALSAFKQGELAKKTKNTSLAIQHFSRISVMVPGSLIAANGLYQAISIAFESESFSQVIKLGQDFRKTFPQDKLTLDVLNILSLTYLNEKQYLRAADILTTIAQVSDNDEVKKVALLKAGELYEKENKVNLAIINYKKYAHNYIYPIDKNIEARYSLTNLYEKKGNDKNADFWRRKTLSLWRRTSKNNSSDRIQYIVANQSLALGNRSKVIFNRYQLVHPLKLNLKKKKSHMLSAAEYYKIAASFPFSEIQAEAVYQLGTLYANFSEALLDSERPSSLSLADLEQYEILLEDQAFPFEDQAIELHESNLRFASHGVTSKWIKLSHTALKNLYPARYKKYPKVDAVIYDYL